MTLRSFGTHNLHDAAGVPTFFADAVLFTEAIAPTIRTKARAARARLAGRLSGYAVHVCGHQRDLVVALRRRHYQVTDTHYELAHQGVAEVTPHRGTYAVETIERATGRAVVFIVEHRINAAFRPWVRGEKVFRQNMWHRHTGLTERLIRSYLADGWEVRAGGDLNTPRDVRGYSLLSDFNEYGSGFDRLASSSPLLNGEVLSRMESVDPRLRAWS